MTLLVLRGTKWALRTGSKGWLSQSQPRDGCGSRDRARHDTPPSNDDPAVVVEDHAAQRSCKTTRSTTLLLPAATTEWPNLGPNPKRVSNTIPAHDLSKVRITFVRIQQTSSQKNTFVRLDTKIRMDLPTRSVVSFLFVLFFF